jgi:hypothetical protein
VIVRLSCCDYCILSVGLQWGHCVCGTEQIEKAKLNKEEKER